MNERRIINCPEIVVQFGFKGKINSSNNKIPVFWTKFHSETRQQHKKGRSSASATKELPNWLRENECMKHNDRCESACEWSQRSMSSARGAGRRWGGGWWCTLYGRCISEKYAWNFYSLVNQCHPNTFDEIRSNCCLVYTFPYFFEMEVIYLS